MKLIVFRSKALWILLFAAVFGFAGVFARADSVNFNFSGMLSPPGSGNLGSGNTAITAVTGTFMLNTTNDTVTTFDFTTPDGPFSSSTSGFTGSLVTFTPAFSPAADFVGLSFEDNAGVGPDGLVLFFETNLAAFSTSGGTLYTGGLEPTSTLSGESGLDCFFLTLGPTCSVQNQSNFASGSATPLTATPEPGALSLMTLGLLAGLWFGRKRIFAHSEARQI